MAEQPLTFNQTVHAITEFIEVAIHTILYVRQIYPAEIFVRRKKYDTPVFQSRHPALNEYISGAVKAIGDELVHGKVDKVVIVIKDKQEVALERFIISVETMVEIEGYNKETPVEAAMSPSSLGQYFRSFMVKLNMIESQIGQMYLGDDVSFAVVIELKDDVAPSHSNTKDPPPWIPAVTQHTSSGVGTKSELHMVRAVNTGIINLSLGVQESAEKIERERKKRPPKKRSAPAPAPAAAAAAPTAAAASTVATVEPEPAAEGPEPAASTTAAAPPQLPPPRPTPPPDADKENHF